MHVLESTAKLIDAGINVGIRREVHVLESTGKLIDVAKLEALLPAGITRDDDKEILNNIKCNPYI